MRDSVVWRHPGEVKNRQVLAIEHLWTGVKWGKNPCASQTRPVFSSDVENLALHLPYTVSGQQTCQTYWQTYIYDRDATSNADTLQCITQEESIFDTGRFDGHYRNSLSLILSCGVELAGVQWCCFSVVRLMPLLASNRSAKGALRNLSKTKTSSTTFRVKQH